jgi:hypothetical protein
MSIVKIRAALETALSAMPGIIPEANITASSSGIFTTSAPHLLSVGVHALIANHTGVNGVYAVDDVPTDLTFTIVDVVTREEIVSTGTGGTVLAQLIAWENMFFPAIANSAPYLKVNLLPAQPSNPTFGDGFYREFGIFQVTLVYPLQLGTGDAYARAELIRSAFPRGASFSNSGTVVKIDKTPEIMGQIMSDDSYMLPVRIYYYADIFN